MKITPTNSLSASRIGSGPRSPAAPGFALPTAGEVAGPSGSAPSMGVSGVNSLDALIALQQVDDPMTRRKRAIRGASRLLDALDEIKLAMLEDQPSPAALQRLAVAVREERANADDVGLQGLLDQIETRAAVEMAKADMRGGQA